MITPTPFFFNIKSIMLRIEKLKWLRLDGVLRTHLGDLQSEYYIMDTLVLAISRQGKILEWTIKSCAGVRSALTYPIIMASRGLKIYALA